MFSVTSDPAANVSFQAAPPKPATDPIARPDSFAALVEAMPTRRNDRRRKPRRRPAPQQRPDDTAATRRRAPRQNIVGQCGPRVPAIRNRPRQSPIRADANADAGGLHRPKAGCRHPATGKRAVQGSGDTGSTATPDAASADHAHRHSRPPDSGRRRARLPPPSPSRCHHGCSDRGAAGNTSDRSPLLRRPSPRVPPSRHRNAVSEHAQTAPESAPERNTAATATTATEPRPRVGAAAGSTSRCAHQRPDAGSEPVATAVISSAAGARRPTRTGGGRRCRDAVPTSRRRPRPSLRSRRALPKAPHPSRPASYRMPILPHRRPQPAPRAPPPQPNATASRKPTVASRTPQSAMPHKPVRRQSQRTAPSAHEHRAAAGQISADASDVSQANAAQQPQLQLDHAASAIPLTATAATAAAVPLSGLAVEIAVFGAKRQDSFDIRLDPADLGRIDVRIDVDRNGQVTSHLTVEKPETLAMLQQDAPQLQRALDDAGLKTGNGGLQFSLRDQSSSGQNNGNERRQCAAAGHQRGRYRSRRGRGTTYGRTLGSSGGVDIRV